MTRAHKNCPYHRTKLEIIREVSNPKDKKMMYYCARCEALWQFKHYSIQSRIALKVGIRYSKLKRAGFLSGKDLNRSV